MNMTSKRITHWPRRAALGMEHLVYRGSDRLRKVWRGKGKPMVPEVYRAFSFRGKVDVKGRVLAARTLPEPRENDSWWTNGKRMLRRWMTSECPDIPVVVSVGGVSRELVTDEEGYFEVEIENPDLSETVEIRLPRSGGDEIFSEDILFNDDAPSVVVISDVDDTVFISNTAKLLGMVKTALTGNALTRQIFPGVPELYARLRGGPGGSERNPISYVTSSPWNLHSLMKNIFENRNVPAGAYFMTDWGLSHDNWLKESNHAHKRRAILQIMGWFPDAPVVLLGDSSQHDAEIYTRIATEFPDRIAAIVIRDVTMLGEAVGEIPDGVPFLLHEDTDKAREFIMRRLGWDPA